MTPDNGKIHADIFVSRRDSMGAVNGHKVVVKISDRQPQQADTGERSRRSRDTWTIRRGHPVHHPCTMTCPKGFG